VLTGSEDKTARLWDAATGKEIRAFTGHEGNATSVALRQWQFRHASETVQSKALTSPMGLGRVETALKEVGSESQEPRVSQAAIAAISGLIPTMFMTRVRLYARTERAISAATFGRVLVRKCVAPIRAFIVPNGCSTVSRR
jgi:hypothetical protein